MRDRKDGYPNFLKRAFWKRGKKPSADSIRDSRYAFSIRYLSPRSSPRCFSRVSPTFNFFVRGVSPFKRLTFQRPERRRLHALRKNSLGWDRNGWRNRANRENRQSPKVFRILARNPEYFPYFRFRRGISEIDGIEPGIVYSYE